MKTMPLLQLVLLLLALQIVPASAHETPIALLEIRETQSGSYVTYWTYSSSTQKSVPTPVYPAHCLESGRRLECGEQGLVGELTFARLGVSYSAVVVRITNLVGEMRSFTLSGAQPAVMLTPSGTLPVTQVMNAYVPLGIEHILLGVDHLLFVLGLMILVRGTANLVKTITAFTIAHSFSLAAATLGWIGVPEAPVNAAIALSIVVLGVEIVEERRGKRSFSAQYPWLVAFAFGLLHGLGFASALTDIGLPEQNIPLALLFFNIGVELGQLGFVGLVLLLVWAHRTLQARPPEWMATAAIYGVGALASFWFVSRTYEILFPPVTL